MAWCGCSRKGRQSLASSGGGGAGWSVCTSTPYILWRRRSSKALRPFSGDVYGWVFCAKNWQLHRALPPWPGHAVCQDGSTGAGPHRVVHSHRDVHVDGDDVLVASGEGNPGADDRVITCG